MRKAIIIYGLLLPFLLASSQRFADPSSDFGAHPLWNSPAATASENVEDDNGVSVDNLITIAPLFDAVASYVIPVVNFARSNYRSANSYDPSCLITLNLTFRI